MLGCAPDFFPFIYQLNYVFAWRLCALRPLTPGPPPSQAIAAAGVTSRRGADELIFGGKVTVNGLVVEEPGRQVDLRKDKVGGGPSRRPAVCGFGKACPCSVARLPALAFVPALARDSAVC
jgi:hypothetical protein